MYGNKELVSSVKFFMVFMLDNRFDWIVIILIMIYREIIIFVEFCYIGINYLVK